MSEILKLKKWLTLEEAAKEISIQLQEEVILLDLYRMALDKHIQLSVYFPNTITVRKHEVVNWKNTSWSIFPRFEKAPKKLRRLVHDYRIISQYASVNKTITELPHIKISSKLIELGEKLENVNNPIPIKLKKLLKDVIADKPEITIFEFCKQNELLILSLYLGNGKYLNHEDKLSTIHGLWKLPMYGGEHKLLRQKINDVIANGLKDEFISLDGAFVCDYEEKTYYQIYHPDIEIDFGDFVNLSKLKKVTIKEIEELKLRVKDLKEDTTSKTYMNFKTQLYHKECYLAALNNEDSNYYPSDLPEDVAIVVRVEDINSFVSNIKNSNKPLNTKERNSFLAIIASLCTMHGIDTSKPSKYAKLISEEAQRLGLSLSENNIAEKLKEINELCERRD